MEHITPSLFLELLDKQSLYPELWNRKLNKYCQYCGLYLSPTDHYHLIEAITEEKHYIGNIFEHKPVTLYDKLKSYEGWTSMDYGDMLDKYKSQLESIIVEE